MRSSGCLTWKISTICLNHTSVDNVQLKEALSALPVNRSMNKKKQKHKCINYGSITSKAGFPVELANTTFNRQKSETTREGRLTLRFQASRKSSGHTDKKKN